MILGQTSRSYFTEALRELTPWGGRMPKLHYAVRSCRIFVWGCSLLWDFCEGQEHADLHFKWSCLCKRQGETMKARWYLWRGRKRSAEPMKAHLSWEHCSKKQSENCKYPAKSFPRWNLINSGLPLYFSTYFCVLKIIHLKNLLYSVIKTHGFYKFLFFTALVKLTHFSQLLFPLLLVTDSPYTTTIDQI